MNGLLQTTIYLSSLTTKEVEKWKSSINLCKMNPTHHTCLLLYPVLEVKGCILPVKAYLCSFAPTY